MATFTVTDTGDAGPGSLRQAILDANATPEFDTITFNITDGAGPVKTISPTEPLPWVTAPVFIDGSRQAGYLRRPVIELDGSGAGVGPDDWLVGLAVSESARRTLIRGLAVSGWRDAGIVIEAADCSVEECHLGTDATGTLAKGNGIGLLLGPFGDGVSTGATGCRVNRSVISGNGTGVSITGSGVGGNELTNNLIGVNAPGTGALGNRTDGVFIAEGGPTGNRIGTINGLGNTIAGNGRNGVVLGSDGNVVRKNLIGRYADLNFGPRPLPNGGDGVSVFSSGNEVVANTVAHNAGTGVLVARGQRNAILSNTIFDNGGPAIDLGGDGATANDAGDADDGANHLQNFPVITSAVATAVNTVVSGTLDSTPDSQFHVELFADAGETNRNAFGERYRLVESTQVATDSTGNAAFSLTVRESLTGNLLMATATRKIDGLPVETSELSPGTVGRSGGGPAVRQVLIRSSGWSASFLDRLARSVAGGPYGALGSREFGYAMPADAYQPSQVPWTGIDRISIQFTEPVEVEASDLTVTGADDLRYLLRDDLFTYDDAMRTATFALAAPVESDRLVLRLNSAGVTGGGRLLDGEWVSSTDDFPSGNGTPGGDFVFRMNVLPGDVNFSGAVLADDASGVKQKFFTSVERPGSGDGAYSFYADVNGSGTILADDFSEAKRRFFTTLPPLQPAAAAQPLRRILAVGTEVLEMTR
jgi:hypothetical protein